jgi:predicted RNA-binding Zn-ribbon protein involved in translation (DUF1610 family)
MNICTRYSQTRTRVTIMSHTLNGTDYVQPIVLCPRCDDEMLLHEVAPREPGMHLLTFECPKCGHLETRVVDTR